MPHDGLTLLFLALAGLLAGCCDAIAGGGGLIQFPALLIAMPTTAPAALVGANKFAGVLGTATAVKRIAKLHPPRASVVLPLVATGAIGSVAGARLVTAVSPNLMKFIVVVVLTGVWIFTWKRKGLGESETLHSSRRHMTVGLVGGTVIGIYNGLIGPGTGTFLIFLLAAGVGFSFLQASATAKIVDICSDSAAFVTLAISGHVLWKLGFLLAVCNIAGNMIGSHLALRHGSRFVRKAFLVIVPLLMIRLATDLL